MRDRHKLWNGQVGDAHWSSDRLGRQSGYRKLFGLLWAPLVAAAFVVAIQAGRDYSEIGNLKRMQASLVVEQGRALFGRHCVDCHGETAAGADGPCLRGITKTDEWLRQRIAKGVKGKMPVFQDTLTAEDTAAVISFLRTLK